MPRESGASSKHRPQFYLKSLWLLDRPLPAFAGTSFAGDDERWVIHRFLGVRAGGGGSGSGGLAPTTVVGSPPLQSVSHTS